MRLSDITNALTLTPPLSPVKKCVPPSPPPSSLTAPPSSLALPPFSNAPIMLTRPAYVVLYTTHSLMTFISNKARCSRCAFYRRNAGANDELLALLSAFAQKPQKMRELLPRPPSKLSPVRKAKARSFRHASTLPTRTRTTRVWTGRERGTSISCCKRTKMVVISGASLKVLCRKANCCTRCAYSFGHRGSVLSLA